MGLPSTPGRPITLPFISGGLLTDDFAHVEHLTHIPTAARIVDAPDTFGFYRPVTQASIALDLAVHGPRPSRLRALNVVLHACVIGLAFWVARLVLGSPLAAGLATLAFAMTPKAHPIAVLWISARAELLMSAFSLIAVAAWIRWTRNGRVAWLLGAAGAYILALLSKETATLLPILLLFTPGSQRTRRSRAGAVAALCGLRDRDLCLEGRHRRPDPVLGRRALRRHDRGEPLGAQPAELHRTNDRGASRPDLALSDGPVRRQAAGGSGRCGGDARVVLDHGESLRLPACLGDRLPGAGATDRRAQRVVSLPAGLRRVSDRRTAGSGADLERRAAADRRCATSSPSSSPCTS